MCLVRTFSKSFPGEEIIIGVAKMEEVESGELTTKHPIVIDFSRLSPKGICNRCNLVEFTTNAAISVDVCSSSSEALKDVRNEKNPT